MAMLLIKPDENGREFHPIFDTHNLIPLFKYMLWEAAFYVNFGFPPRGNVEDPPSELSFI
jgi:hypothetical protein